MRHRVCKQPSIWCDPLGCDGCVACIGPVWYTGTPDASIPVAKYGHAIHSGPKAGVLRLQGNVAIAAVASWQHFASLADNPALPLTHRQEVFRMLHHAPTGSALPILLDYKHAPWL